MNTKTVITGTIGSDCHVVATQLLSRALREAGFSVHCLGALVSQEEFINASIETDADAILVSSIYGHAILDCEGLRDKCVEAGRKDILLYVGGILTVTAQDWGEVEKTFKEMGFNRVYPPDTLPSRAIAHLKKDLGVG